MFKNNPFNRRNKQEAEQILTLAEDMAGQPESVDLLAPAAEPADHNGGMVLVSREEANKQLANAPAIGDYTAIKLGDIVRDRLSGIVGSAIERQYHLNGCQFLVIDPLSGAEDIVEALQRYELVESRPAFHREDESMDGAHVKLGDEAKDTLSGFKGHVVAWAIALFGAHRIGIDPGLKKDGTLGSVTFFDECRVELVVAKKPPQVPAAKRKVAKERGCLPTTMRRETMDRR